MPMGIQETLSVHIRVCFYRIAIRFGNELMRARGISSACGIVMQCLIFDLAYFIAQQIQPIRLNALKVSVCVCGAHLLYVVAQFCTTSSDHAHECMDAFAMHTWRG